MITNDEVKLCPFCGGKAKISFKDYKFGGKNYFGDRKVKYRVQVICNKCKSRGKPIITDWMINPYPYSTIWGNSYGDTERCNKWTKEFEPYVDKAIIAWNNRKKDSVN